MPKYPQSHLHLNTLSKFCGGAAKLFSSRRIDRWADLDGKVKVYRLVGIAALLPLMVVTHIGAASRTG